MTDGHTYRFTGAGHFARCLRAPLAVHRRFDAARGELAASFAAGSRHFLALARGDFVRVDAAGVLRRDDGCAGPSLGAVQRIDRSAHLIAALAGERLFIVDGESLRVDAMFTLPGAHDMALDGSRAVYWLTDADLFRLDLATGVSAAVELPVAARLDMARVAVAGGTLFLLDPAANRLVALLPDAQRLEIGLSGLHGAPGATFAAREIASDDGALLLTGDWGATAGFVVLNAVGDMLCSGTWESADRPLSVAVLGTAMIAFCTESGGVGARLFDGAAAPGGEQLLTPVMESDTLAGDWRQAVAQARLPRGATLTIDRAATRDEALVRLAGQTAQDGTVPVSERIARLRSLLPLGSGAITYVGEAQEQPLRAEPFSSALRGAEGQYLWLDIRLTRNAAETQPEIVALAVHHDEPGLMDYLPAVFGTPAGDADGTMRRLVEVLEATFLGFDEAIGGLADRLDPQRAEARWLGPLARMLGLPFDDALNQSERRGLLHAASAIMARRGTTDGVRALLAGVLGERPYRVIDRTEGLMPMTLGGKGFAGSRLPGFLSGPSVQVPRLNARLVLGRTPLGSFDPCDTDVQVSRGAELLVIVPARDAERDRLGAALQQMIEAIVPAGVRLDLRWTGIGDGAGGTVLGTMDDWPTVSLGHARPGTARLAGSHAPRLREGGLAAERRLT